MLLTAALIIWLIAIGLVANAIVRDRRRLRELRAREAAATDRLTRVNGALMLLGEDADRLFDPRERR